MELVGEHASVRDPKYQLTKGVCLKLKTVSNPNDDEAKLLKKLDEGQTTTTKQHGSSTADSTVYWILNTWQTWNVLVSNSVQSSRAMASIQSDVSTALVTSSSSVSRKLP